MLLGEELQIDAKNSNFEIFESTLYTKSGGYAFNHHFLNKTGVKLSEVYQAAVQKVKSEKPALLSNMTKNVG